MNITQWRHHADKGEIKRVTWCCGDQPVLVEELVDRLRSTLRPGVLDSVTVTAGTVPDQFVWATAHQYPLDPDTPRLVTIRHAEQLAQWHQFPVWLNQRRANPSYLLFVSSEPEVSSQDHISLIRRAGHVVHCTAMSMTDLVVWVQTMAPLDDERATYLAQRSAGDLQQLKSVAGKLALFSEPPSTRAIDELCDEAPNEQFTDAVILLKTRAAHSLISQLPAADYRRVIGQLDFRLGVMAQLHHAVHTQLSRRDIALIPGLPHALVERFLPVVDHYPAAQCRHRRQMLASLDAALATGAQEGVLESLVTLWV